MIRASLKFIIYLKDLQSRMVTKKNFTFKGKNFVEYWIYHSTMEKTGILNTVGKMIMKKKKSKAELHAIICCPTTHIRKKFPESIIIEGVKFDNMETNDVNEYLRRTGRTTI